MTKLFALTLLLVGCGDDGGSESPDAVRFGDTAIVVIANPLINDVNQAAVVEPGTRVGDIEIDVDSGAFDVTDSAGIAVLPVPGGTRRLEFSSGVAGEIVTQMPDDVLREMAVAVDDGAEIMATVDYDFAGQVVELTPSMSSAEIEAALASSDTIVVFREGTYVVGDLELSGSRVTLFAEGIYARTVLIDGNLTVTGSDNRVRGVFVTGDLIVDGSGAGLSFNTVDGATRVSGSDAFLLANELCGEVSVSGSAALVVGNGGLAPVPADCD